MTEKSYQVVVLEESKTCCFGGWLPTGKTMTFAESFASQIETTRLLVEEDNHNPVVWNGVNSSLTKI
jgi:hypothetical protein